MLPMPEHLVPYKRPSDYMGATFPGTFKVYGIHRDSDSLERSNFLVLQRGYGEAPGVFITRASHWLVGWVDTMRVDPAEASEDTLRGLDAALARIEEYPVLDEDHWSELRWNEVTEWWARESVAWRVEMCRRAGLSVFAARSAEFPHDDTGSLFELLTQ